MKTNHSIIIQWSEADQVFIASVPEVTGLNAFGETPEEAIKELNVAKELFLQVMNEDGESIPDPDLFVQHSGQLRIRIPKSLHASLSYEAKKEGVSLNTYISHLLSERNAFQKVKKEIGKNNRVVVFEPLYATAGTSDQSFIMPSHTLLPHKGSPVAELMGIGSDPMNVYSYTSKD
jgi:predicted RNase H-like HicB family nuclease